MNFQKFSRLLVEFAEQNMERWNELDSAQGDGDLGVTLLLAAKALSEAGTKYTSPKEWLMEGGRSIRKAAPSTMGILIASSLIAAGKSAEEGKLLYSLEDWAAIQQTIVVEIQKRGGAKLGDKTVLDALIPAVTTFCNGVEKGKSVQTILQDVVVVAKQSAEQTAAMVSRIGRSSWLGERAQGNIDGGAWVCYQLYEFILNQIERGRAQDEES